MTKKKLEPIEAEDTTPTVPPQVAPVTKVKSTPHKSSAVICEVCGTASVNDICEVDGSKLK